MSEVNIHRINVVFLFQLWIMDAHYDVTFYECVFRCVVFVVVFQFLCAKVFDITLSEGFLCTFLLLLWLIFTHAGCIAASLNYISAKQTDRPCYV